MSSYEPIRDITDLEALYGTPSDAAMQKVAQRLTPTYRRLIEASPFFTLATVGPEGLDCSPRGELGGAFVIADDKTLIIPDRRGNNRMDTLRNIVADPRIAALFLIPGSNTTIRMNGSAVVTTHQALLETMARDGKMPRSAIVITINEIYTQCGRAVIRAGLWDNANHVDITQIPSPGDVLREQTDGVVDGKSYDEAWDARAEKSMW